MPSVPKRHPVRFQTRGESQDLMTHTDPKDGLVPFFHRLPHPHRRVHDGLGVSGAVGEEETVVLIPDGVEVEIPGEDGHSSVPTDETTDDIRLGTEIEEGDVDVPLGVEGVDFLGRGLGDKVILGRIPVLCIFRSGLSDVFSPDGQPPKGRPLITQERGDGPRVHA